MKNTEHTAATPPIPVVIATARELIQREINKRTQEREKREQAERARLLERKKKLGDLLTRVQTLLAAALLDRDAEEFLHREPWNANTFNTLHQARRVLVLWRSQDGHPYFLGLERCDETVKLQFWENRSSCSGMILLSSLPQELLPHMPESVDEVLEKLLTTHGLITVVMRSAYLAHQ